MKIIKWETVGQKLVKFKTIDLELGKKEQKAPYFATFVTKYGVFLTI